MPLRVLGIASLLLLRETGQMRLGWHTVGLAALLAYGPVACATGFVDNRSSGGGGDPGWGGEAGTGVGGGGAGGAGGAGGEAGAGVGGGTSSSSSSSSSTSGGNDTCGNGVKDPGEQCDIDDFGGKTCADYGLGSGTLVCNMFCGVIASACLPKETCNDFKDNDQDGDVDCLDSDCSGQVTCLDSCASPKLLSVPGGSEGDTTGRPATIAPSCSNQSGPEAVYKLAPAQTGPVTVRVSSWSGADLSVSIRIACAEDMTEINCVNDYGPNSFGEETLTFDALAGQTYFLIVDSASLDPGAFYVAVDVPKPEQFCSDFFDDDNDGYLDCDDPTSCQQSFECMPGMSAVGEQCFGNYECMANANDPVCLTTSQGFLDGYCSEWCDLVGQDCPGDAVCADLGLSFSGVCLDGCLTDADCRPNYACVDKGYSSKVCMLSPETDCSNYADEDLDSRIDCEDSDCQGTPACTGGSKAVGQPCTDHAECYAVGGDPLCLSGLQYGFPDGYCSEFCYFMNDCGPGALCSTWFFFPSGAGTCMDTCVADAQCRPGYACLDVGLPQKICLN
jgi:hypothetical protein